MEIQYRHTPAGTIISICEWDRETEDNIWTYYHWFEDEFNGPFIDYYFIGEIIEFETEDKIFIKFNSHKKTWSSSTIKESFIIKGEEVDQQNEQLEIWYALHTIPASA